MTTRESALFIYAPAAYAKTPLHGKWVFAHGQVHQKITQGNEHRFIVEDAKGKWEGYTYAGAHAVEAGQAVRGYGQLKLQPDGNCKIALQWIKPIEEKEKQYMETHTQSAWGKLVEAYPQLPLLQPFENKPIRVQENDTRPKSSEPQQEEFIPASELKVEEDYV